MNSSLAYASGRKASTGIRRGSGSVSDRVRRRGTKLWFALALVSMLNACGEPGPTGPTAPAPSGLDASQIVNRYQAGIDSRDSTIRLRALITDTSSSGVPPKHVQVTIYRKRSSDGAQKMLVEFKAPTEERDRAALITMNAQGEVEATRYTQSADTFAATTGVTTEESLFGMTLQELLDGQPEKYDFTLTGEVEYLNWTAYRLEGTLKQGAESRFRRMVLLISKESFSALAAEFFDPQDLLARRMTVDHGELISNYWTRINWTLENYAREKRIDFETTEAKYDQNLSDSIFTREHLKRIAMR